MRLPPYVFATIDARKMDCAGAGEDVIDLGFGNPDLPSPYIAVEKLCEAARNPRNHRYSASRGIPKLRARDLRPVPAAASASTLDPETEAITTIGAKEGLSHLMWTLVQPGDSALVPSPATRSTSTRRCWPAPRSARCASGPSRTSSPTSTQPSRSRGPGPG